MCLSRCHCVVQHFLLEYLFRLILGYSKKFHDFSLKIFLSGIRYKVFLSGYSFHLLIFIPNDSKLQRFGLWIRASALVLAYSWGNTQKHISTHAHKHTHANTSTHTNSTNTDAHTHAHPHTYTHTHPHKHTHIPTYTHTRTRTGSTCQKLKSYYQCARGCYIPRHVFIIVIIQTLTINTFAYMDKYTPTIV